MDNNTYMSNLEYNLALFGSNFDIMNALHCGDDKIIKYSELTHYNSLEELLPVPFDFKIILLETARNSGHWVCVIRMSNVVECFNSYGVMIDYEFRFIPDTIERMLGESKRYLSNLVKKNTIFKIVNNTYKFQSKNTDVATCSRWVILRIECAKMGYDLKDFINMIHRQTVKTQLPTDILVLNYVKFHGDKPLG